MHIKIVISFLLLNVSICSSYALDIKERFNDANALILSENFPKAKKILIKLSKENPDNIQISNNMAYIEAKLGNIDEAIKILRNSITSNKDIDVVYKNLTNLYAFQANVIYEEALSIKEPKNNINLTLLENLKTTNKKKFNQVKSDDIKKIPYINKIDPKDVKKFINEWASSWQNKDFKKYFSSYGENYHSLKFKSNSAWKNDRKNKIKNKNNIEIKISNIKFINYDNKDILAQFTQSYNSDSFSDVVNKHFTITLVGEIFKITGEYTLK
ncbi:MAG: tetratricopeptide repeat protein [Gammaproteobacteria bacterium]|jgi:tetratricopeptide (TPR) repeat protein|nr:tetratricopeptide repeat protein [Gammaproteobacteria bacterium]MBT6755459.1 tetratricopeptide repeat protein [Gammaproteobacteria bacterium]MBT7523854.1 tetratricopeptide repeat protein [Gammaproteobacteria bacterium]MBT7814357.1 tetratricopeptide repeat protein [Gammaproteobacteria bacterium]